LLVFVWRWLLFGGTTQVIAWDKLQLGDVLGYGTFGVVRRATLEGTPVAVKLVNISENTNGRCMTKEQFNQEAELLMYVETTTTTTTHRALHHLPLC